MTSLSVDEVAWLAGLLEGEGCFSVHRRAGRTPAVDVRVSMQDEDVIRMAATLMDGRVNRLEARGSAQRPSYVAAIRGDKAKEIMKKIRPYMGQRRGAKIDELLRDF